MNWKLVYRKQLLFMINIIYVYGERDALLDSPKHKHRNGYLFRYQKLIEPYNVYVHISLRYLLTIFHLFPPRTN